MKLRSSLLVLAAALFSACCSVAPNVKPEEMPKPRVIVTCDPELDDNNSLIRYILHAPDFVTEGIVYASSKFHWMGDGKGTTQFIPGNEYDKQGLGPQTSWRWADGERFIDDVVEAYEKVYSNLKIHDSSYPTPEELKSKVKIGNVIFEGDYSYDSDGSNLIKQVLLDDKPGPVFVQTWGGASTAAAALRSIEDEYKGTDKWNEIYNKVCKKIVLCMSGDQDGSYPNYIAKSWPDAGVQSVRGGGVPLAYNAQRSVRAEYAFYLTPEWMAENVLAKGPLGALYRVWGDGKQMVKDDKWDYFGFADVTEEELKKQGYFIWTPLQPKGSFLAEGDTGCYLNMIDNGLRAWQDQTWAGWSGRKRDVVIPEGLSPQEAMRLRFQPDSILPYFFPEVMDALAVRLQWSVTDKYEDANHYPSISAPLAVEAEPGKSVKIRPEIKDPDGDNLTYNWRVFPVGTYKGNATLAKVDGANVDFEVPADAVSGDTIHLLLDVKDDGIPSLNRYHRVVITVK